MDSRDRDAERAEGRRQRLNDRMEWIVYRRSFAAGAQIACVVTGLAVPLWELGIWEWGEGITISVIGYFGGGAIKSIASMNIDLILAEWGHLDRDEANGVKHKTSRDPSAFAQIGGPARAGTY